ncbi:MAG: ABC transporter permease [Deltaproteobacteria bacterium]
MKASTIKNSILTFISFILIIVLWKLASLLVGSEIIIPSPESTFNSLASIVASESFLRIIFETIVRVLEAFLIACIAGIVVGLITGFSKIIDSLFKPFLVIIMSTPVISFILIALIWFKSGEIPIFVAFLVIFPIITTNVSEGIKNIDLKLVQMTKAYRIKRIRVLTEVYLPSILSYLVAGISTAVGIGWKVVITTEVLSQPKFSIGTSLDTAKVYLETSNVFAWTIIAILLSFFFEKLVRLVESQIFKWR